MQFLTVMLVFQSFLVYTHYALNCIDVSYPSVTKNGTSA